MQSYANEKKYLRPEKELTYIGPQKSEWMTAPGLFEREVFVLGRLFSLFTKDTTFASPLFGTLGECLELTTPPFNGLSKLDITAWQAADTIVPSLWLAHCRSSHYSGHCTPVETSGSFHYGIYLIDTSYLFAIEHELTFFYRAALISPKSNIASFIAKFGTRQNTST